MEIEMNLAEVNGNKGQILSWGRGGELDRKHVAK